MRHSLKCLALSGALAGWLPFAAAQDVSAPPPSKHQVQDAMKAQLPAPADGFGWQQYKNVVFMKPVGWHEAEMARDIAGVPLFTYATSPEAFSSAKPFETGATIELIKAPQRTRGMEARKFALAYLKPFLDSHKKEEVLILDQKTRGDFEQTVFRYRDAPPGLKPIIVHKFIVANNVTDTVNVFTFESPVETWNDHWARYGTHILGKLSILPDVPAQ